MRSSSGSDRTAWGRWRALALILVGALAVRAGAEPSGMSEINVLVGSYPLETVGWDP